VHKSAILLLALTLAAPAHAQLGRTFHYERSNIDGSEPEQIYHHRAAIDRTEVYKAVARCTGSALVSAAIDPRTGVATQLVGGRLRPGAERAPQAWLNDEGTRLSGLINMPGMQKRVEAPVRARPWHQYDYDLATLSAAFQARKGSRAPMRFGLALFWFDAKQPDKLLHWLGDATARFVRAERHLERETLRFEVSGPAFGKAGGGPLWVDAAEGYLVDVQWGRPNHDNYKDFRLRLIGEEPAGAQAWTALLRRHYEGCPTPSGGTSAP
jgi:hypothetical protein